MVSLVTSDCGRKAESAGALLETAAREYGPLTHPRSLGAEGVGLVDLIGRHAPVAGFRAWVTGVRREQSALHTELPPIEWDLEHGLYKISLHPRRKRAACDKGRR